MKNYFRITAYDTNSDTSAILDSNGKFEKLSAFSLYLVNKGLKIFAVDNGETFTDGNIEKISPNTEKIVMRAHAQGKPIRNNKNITVGDKTYVVS